MFTLFHICRVVLGIIFLMGAINGFFFFFGFDTFLPESPKAIALLGDGYLLVMVKSVELLGAILLIANRYVVFATLILLPITVNILAFHLFVDPNLIVGIIVLILFHLYLLFVNRKYYANLLTK
ncbi:hypothetical protein JOC85_001058 [Bacillus mesophilus]|uniref:DoxX family membrane protein n=1 Tax=Bacillus mesophilus TaxID=1808955 RepID=A0A6M0Q468_9BACI|nr:hypothetical protein [Bacillus mesophilus]MBM7660291.1 hypothetical protein [Bacillus mesophilus]NEY71004.1 hypothetical protein [Bacillus mesophilus]